MLSSKLSERIVPDPQARRGTFLFSTVVLNVMSNDLQIGLLEKAVAHLGERTGSEVYPCSFDGNSSDVGVSLYWTHFRLLLLNLQISAP